MSSEIVPGLDTMALAERAWHGYGTVVGRNMTYAEAMAIAGLDWTARLAPLTTMTPDGVVEVDTHRATYRSDTGAVLGVVGADYQPHQPAELLELARLTLDAAPTDAHVEVVGSLRAGRTVFMTIALPDDIDIAGDVHMPRLVWVTSMDGTIATRAVSTYVRAVCANTIRASFRHARTSWAARHTSRLDGRAADARAGPAADVQHRRHVPRRGRSAHPPDDHRPPGRAGPHRDLARQARRHRPGPRRRRPPPRRRAAMYRSDPRVAGWHGTAYGLVQAASTWEQWHAPRRGDRGEQVLAGLFAGGRSLAVDVAERIAALA